MAAWTPRPDRERSASLGNNAHAHPPPMFCLSDDMRAFDSWQASPVGRYVSACQQRLVERLTASWPRRGRTLLEIGCGGGVFLEYFHHAGFSATGAEHSPVAAKAARIRLGDACEVDLCALDHLPYADDSFDYVALVNPLLASFGTQDVLCEAARVARRAVLVGYLNQYSFARLACPAKPGDHGRAFASFCGMRRMMRAACGNAPLCELSTLFGPVCLWRQDRFVGRLGQLVFRLPVGAYCAIAADLSAPPAMTGLPALWTRLRAQSLFDKASASG